MMCPQTLPTHAEPKPATNQVLARDVNQDLMPTPGPENPVPTPPEAANQLLAGYLSQMLVPMSPPPATEPSEPG